MNSKDFLYTYIKNHDKIRLKYKKIARILFDPKYIINKDEILTYVIKHDMEISKRWNYIHPRNYKNELDLSNYTKKEIYKYLCDKYQQITSSTINIILATHNLCVYLDKNIQEIYNDLNRPQKCVICDLDNKFVSFKKGYSKLCGKQSCLKKYRKLISLKREERFRTTILNDGRTLKEHIIDKGRDILSKKLKQKIADGLWTPKVTNSRANSRIYINKIPLRSSWEAYFFILNQNLEYEKTRIKYNFNGVEHIYITDFTDFNNKIIYEIKPLSEITNKKVKAKEKAAKEWCLKNGFKFVFITDIWFKKNYNPDDILSSGLISDEYKDKLIRNLKQFFRG